VAEKNEISSYIVRVVASSPRPLTGHELSILVKTSFPNFSVEQFGCRNLREFIRKYAANEIIEQGRAGMDIIYAPPLTQQQTLFESKTFARQQVTSDQRGPLQQLLTNPRIWKTFVSPAMPFRLFLNPASGQIRVLRPEFLPDPSWFEIRQMSDEKLLQIAKDFIDTLPEPQRSPLHNLLDKPKWWIPYFELVRTLGLTMRWIQYRRRRIAEEFERSLPTLSTTISEMSEAPTAPERHSQVVQLPSVDDQFSIKNIAIAVVQRMSDPELRSLNLPLGYVLDALKAR
jgi:hypothetical protein